MVSPGSGGRRSGHRRRAQRPLTADRSDRQSLHGAEAATCGQRCVYADGWDALRGQEARAGTAAALYEVRIRRLPDAMARAEWQVPRQRLRRYCGRHASRNAHRVPVAARAPRLGLTHALQKRHQGRPFRVSYDLLGRLNQRSLPAYPIPHHAGDQDRCHRPRSCPSPRTAPTVSGRVAS